jgi:GTP-binding protein
LLKKRDLKLSKEIRNLAIIAHVDHGKTTLIDVLLRQSGMFRDNEQVAERMMDSNALEKERGITILSKCTSLDWKNYHLNIVDTPGHADFGGEVERVLSMVNGVVLLVDASEGPMPQTKFVLTKALEQGLKPVVVINKVDKPDARPDEVLDEIFDLFVALRASDDQLDFPVVYASSKEGWAVHNLTDERKDLSPLCEVITTHIKAPNVDISKPFSMLVTTLDYDNFVGRTLTGLVVSGTVKTNDNVKVLKSDGSVRAEGKISKLFAFKGIQRMPIDNAKAGDIIMIAGLPDATVSDTVCSPEVSTPLSSIPVDPPTIAMTFSVNDSPLAGQEGDKVTSRMIRDRLFHEAEINVSIHVRESDSKDAFEVSGRGELQLGILIETMRREGFELSISRPRVLLTKDEHGKPLEPMEELLVDVDDPYVGNVIEKIGMRKGEMIDMQNIDGNKVRIKFIIPARGLIGYRNEFLTDTRGTGIMNKSFHGYSPFKGDIAGRHNGVLISNDQGDAVAYALWNIEERGFLFVGPGEALYQGMIIGENSRPQDLEVNALRGKKLTNVRASGKDDAIRLTPPRLFSLEQALSYITDDELVEVTPKNVRLRKIYLDPNERKRLNR